MKLLNFIFRDLETFVGFIILLIIVFSGITGIINSIANFCK